MLLGKTRNFSDFVIFGLRVFGVYAVLVYGNNCGQSEYQSASGECCPMCNIGSVVFRDCEGDASTTCIPCGINTYMNKPSGLYRCFLCKTCDHVQGLIITQDCTTIQNTVCGILEGYYCKDYGDGECTFALKHRKCQSGQEIKVAGTKNTDTVCEACPSGFYSPLGVNCTKWTDCSVKDEDVDKEGSSCDSKETKREVTKDKPAAANLITPVEETVASLSNVPHQCNPVPSEMEAFELYTDKLGGPFPLESAGHGIHGFQKEFQFFIHMTTEQFSVLPRSILNDI
ncbi:tumor necrosis factor receptor superfamily member 14-like isoform X2 [Electrophorus electricus]|uniref:tumor necrosis factor receptor superfamily member 14-like isoform X2 n=1 Tax=Electrophorus electricus TaxID=8005 RepID=UPI0015CFC8CE|nr:tumor necrosis factor receptor superfamily member 14-like isoform X2 [Electrophorus electricus]